MCKKNRRTHTSQRLQTPSTKLMDSSYPQGFSACESHLETPASSNSNSKEEPASGVATWLTFEVGSMSEGFRSAKSWNLSDFDFMPWRKQTCCVSWKTLMSCWQYQHLCFNCDLVRNMARPSRITRLEDMPMIYSQLENHQLTMVTHHQSSHSTSSAPP